MRVMVVGALGRVGRCIVDGVNEADDMTLAGAVDAGDDLAAAIDKHRPEVAVDFTQPAVVYGNLETLLGRGVHGVVGTTGLSEEQLQSIDAMANKSEVGCMVAPNFALGAVLMMRFAEEAARHFPWVEVVERHHENKLDAPSGTAATTAQRIARVRSDVPKDPTEKETAPGARGGLVDDVTVHSLRLPGSVAHQEVWFGGTGETLVIRHDTIDRRVFVPGVLVAVRGIAKHRGLVRGLEPVLWPQG